MRGDALVVLNATPENFSARKHNLIQAMLAINDLFYLASPFVQGFFIEDVIAWLDLSDIRYTPKVKLTGTSGFDHLFNFVIPKSPKKKQPERIVQAIDRPCARERRGLYLRMERYARGSGTGFQSLCRPE